MEDYIPNLDWGEVKYHHGGKDYRIFYGTELEDPYDLLQLYETVYCPFDEEYLRFSSRSPNEELRSSLILQDKIIKSIDGLPKSGELTKVSVGGKQIPPKYFWSAANSFVTNFNPQEILGEEFLDKYSLDIGELSVDFLNSEHFERMAFEDRILPCIFLRWKERYLPILPRRITSVLLDSWSAIFSQYKNQIFQNENRCHLRLSMEVYKYLKIRIRSDNLFGLVNAVDQENNAHEILFSTTFIAKDRLVLIYVANPFDNPEEVNKELEAVTPKLNRAIELISAPPISLGLNLEKQIVKYQSKSDERKLEPLLLVVLPQLLTQPFGIKLPKSFKGELVFLDQFLALADEINIVDEFIDLFDYKNELGEKLGSPFISLLDVYGSFRDSHGVLVEGASNPNMIMLDPHWGSDMRYESLSKFWSLYPDVGFFDHPRSWMPIKETPTRIRLEARSYFGCAIYSEIGKTKLFFSALFEDFTYEQALITNLLIECLEDSMTRLKQLFERHSFFRLYNRFQVIFFPSGLLQDNKFKHISHLKPDDGYWKLEGGFPARNLPAVRVVFNEDTLLDAFNAVKDNSIEIDLLLAVIKEIDSFAPDDELDAMVQKIEAKKGNPSRFRLFHVEKEVSFPEHIRVYKPTFHDRKRARKKVAELAALNGIHPGTYKLEDAKETLNRLRKLVIHEIDILVSECNLMSSIPYLIERVDSLEHDHEYRKNSVSFSLEHEVDYQREEAYSNEHKEFIQNHKLIRYLIEKFVQLQPTGKEPLTSNLYLFLISLTEMLHEIYTASDNIHYQIYPLGISIGEDYLINVDYEVNIDEMVDKFSQEQARISLGLISDETDRIESPRPLEEYIEELNNAFSKSLGFRLANLISVLHVLSVWPGYDEHSNEKSVYVSDLETIVSICANNILNIDKEEVRVIVEFLTLKSEDVLRILNQKEMSDDIPIWEYRKRYSRYTIRPLIYLGRKYFWGPYSARRAGIIWTNVVSERSLPVDLSSPEIDNVLDSQRRLIEKALEEKALSIAKRHTVFVEPNVELHKRDKNNHPPELGDYDVLAYLSKLNVILSIECKEISRAYCAKDTKRVRDRIFGRLGGEKGYLERVEERELYIKNYWPKVAELMKWPIPLNSPPKVISFLVSRDMYWWTMFPIRKTDVVFIRIDLLSQYLDRLSND